MFKSLLKAISFKEEKCNSEENSEVIKKKAPYVINPKTFNCQEIEFDSPLVKKIYIRNDENLKLEFVKYGYIRLKDAYLTT